MEKAAECGAVLRYLGHGSLRVVTAEKKVIYIDPYAGRAEDYALPADLILVTHAHFDHTALERVARRAPGCLVITQAEALKDGVHQCFALGYVTVEAVEAGYNRNHDVRECVGYILTFADGKTVYISGDTSTTPQMASLSARRLDYAFFCCDGVYNMDVREASACARLVGARHSLPYHNVAAGGKSTFDEARARLFDAPGRILPVPGEELPLT